VEVTLALGVISFGMLAVLGLLPAGLGTFRQSMDTTVASQIFQQIINEAQETDFDQLIKDKTNATISSGSTGVKQIRYFDNQGKELTNATGAIYHVNTRIQVAASSTSPNFTNQNLATVTIQVANNPGGRTLSYETDTALSNLWSGAYEGFTAHVVPIFTASTMVSRQ
jgi:uncharacterized protein (TIGR02598 family)